MYEIRNYSIGDATEICAVFEEAIRTIGPVHYSQAQVDAWLSNAPSQRQVEQRCADGRITLVAVNNNNRVVGYIDLETDGHIDHLYCAPEVAGKGASNALYDQIEHTAQSLGIQRLYTEASEAAKRFFARQGFVVSSRRELLIGNVEIHNYAMIKICRT